jgi:hypothetical protein
MNRAVQEVQMKLLQIDSSACSSSVTRQLTAKFVEEWKKGNPAGEVMMKRLFTLRTSFAKWLVRRYPPQSNKIGRVVAGQRHQRSH